MSDLARVPLIGMAVNAALAVVKIVVGAVGHSYALIADGVESAADTVSSLVVWSGLRVAAAPPDESHPYGHGKAEAIAAAVASLALLVAAVFIAVQSVQEIRHPHLLPHWWTLATLAVVVVVKEALARWTAKHGKAANSTAVESDALHHRSDAITSAAAFVGISIGLIGGPGYEAADDWAALLACGVIAFNGFRLLKAAVDDLMDAAPPADLEKEIRSIAQGVGGVKAIEKMRVRKSGLHYFVEIHVQVDGAVTVREGHAIGHRVHDALIASPHSVADVFAHVEPYLEREI